MAFVEDDRGPLHTMRLKCQLVLQNVCKDWKQDLLLVAASTVEVLSSEER